MKALAKDPQQRFGSVREFANALEEASKKQGVKPKVQMLGGKTKEQWYNEGHAHLNSQRYIEAVAAYSCAIKLDISYVDAYIGRSWAYHQLNEYEKTVTDCDRAITLNPSYALAYINRSAAYIGLKRLPESDSRL